MCRICVNISSNGGGVLSPEFSAEGQALNRSVAGPTPCSWGGPEAGWEPRWVGSFNRCQMPPEVSLSFSARWAEVLPAGEGCPFQQGDPPPAGLPPGWEEADLFIKPFGPLAMFLMRGLFFLVQHDVSFLPRQWPQHQPVPTQPGRLPHALPRRAGSGFQGASWDGPGGRRWPSSEGLRDCTSQPGVSVAGGGAAAPSPLLWRGRVCCLPCPPHLACGAARQAWERRRPNQAVLSQGLPESV